MRSLKGQPSVITTVTDEAPALPFLSSASAIPNATEVNVEEAGQAWKGWRLVGHSGE